MAKGKVMQAVVNLAGSIDPSLGKAIEQAQEKISGLNLKALAVGAAVGGIAVATGKAVVDAGKYLKDLGGQFDMLTLAVYNNVKSGYRAFQFGKFVFKFAYFQLCNTGKPQIQNRLRLTVAKFKTRAQFCFCVACRGSVFYNLNNLVDIFDRYYQSAYDVRALLCFFQFELRTAQYYVALIGNVIRYNIQQPHKLRLTVGNGYHIYSVTHLQIRIFKQIRV